MPTENCAVSQAEKRAWSYWFADGLPNTLGGFGCLLLSLAYMLLIRFRHTRSPLLVGLAILLVGIAWVLLFRLRQTLEWLKARITYPRTGYAASPYFTFRQTEPLPPDLTMLNLGSADNPGILPTTVETARVLDDRKWQVGVLLAVYLAAFLSAALIHERPICAALGIAAALLMWRSAQKNERRSWAVVFGLPYAAMLIFIIAGLNPRRPEFERLAFFLGGAGLLLVLTGGIMLARYLKHNPAAQR